MEFRFSFFQEWLSPYILLLLLSLHLLCECVRVRMCVHACTHTIHVCRSEDNILDYVGSEDLL